MKKKLLLVTLLIFVLTVAMVGCYNSASTNVVLPTPRPKAMCKSKTFAGKGDSVIDVTWVRNCTKATLTHNGARNFIVVPYDANNARHSSLANEIGKYSGTVKWDARAATLEIKADGSWSIKVE